MTKGVDKDGFFFGPVVNWDTGDSNTLYGTIVGIEVSREEICLLFAARTIRTGGTGETIVVGDRIILNPFTAKRMHAVLHRVVARQLPPSAAETEGLRAFRDASEREPF